MLQSEAAAVEPHKKGCLRPYDLDARQCSLAESFYQFDVAFEVVDELLSPLFALGKCGYGRNGGEDWCLVEFVCIEVAEEPVAEGFVRDDGVGAYDAGDVEGLGR